MGRNPNDRTEATGHGLSRRQLLAAGSGGAALLALQPAMAREGASGPVPASLEAGDLDLGTGEGNARLMARIAGNTDPAATKHGWYRGRIMGVAPGGAVRDLLGVMGMSSQRLEPLEDRPGWSLLQKEVGFFFDLATGEIVDKWANPYTGETVEVMHIANPSVSRDIEPVVRDSGFYDDPEKAKAVETPYLLPWQRAGDRLFVEQHMHFWAKNPLDPAIWQRESSGEMLQVSDMISYNVRYSDAANPELTSLENWGSWVHVRPWQPWMLMGTAPGHCLYNCFTGSADVLDDIPEDIVAATRARFPEFLQAPTKRGKSEPSLVRFMRERTPAPVSDNGEGGP